jgi:nucleoside 2-deoxyribosyltransferase
MAEQRAGKAALAAAEGTPPAQLRVYLAAPLFTIQERRLNREVARALERELPGATVLLPQDFKHDGRYNSPRAFGLIFKGCLELLDSSDCMVAWLDGPDADSGTCFEVGYAFAKGIPVVGVRTDFRLNQERGVNVMLSRGCSAFVYRPSFDEDVGGLARGIAHAVEKVAGAKGRTRNSKLET